MTHFFLKSPYSSVITLQHENSRAQSLVARHLLLHHPLVCHHLIVRPLSLTSHLVPLILRLPITVRPTYNRTRTVFLPLTNTQPLILFLTYFLTLTLPITLIPLTL